MSVQRSSELLETVDRGVVKAVLVQTDTFPYVYSGKLKSLSIDNADTNNTLIYTITLIDGNTITNYVRPSTTHDTNYDYFDTIDVSGSTNFILELRGEK